MKIDKVFNSKEAEKILKRVGIKWDDCVFITFNMYYINKGIQVASWSRLYKTLSYTRD